MAGSCNPWSIRSQIVIRALLDAGIESMAICLINSYENPEHEAITQKVGGRISSRLVLSASYEVLPQIREYERTSTTVTNAYVKPITVKYLHKLSARLQSLGFDGNSLSCFPVEGSPQLLPPVNSRCELSNQALRRR